MIALEHELQARDARVDALLESDDRRKLETARKNVALVTNHLREGSTAYQVMIDILDWCERDIQQVLNREAAK